MKNTVLTRREASLLIASTLGMSMLPKNLFGDEKRSLAGWRVGRSVGALQPIENLKLEETRQAGFHCLELSVGAKNYDGWDEKQKTDWFADFKKQAESRGLEVRSLHIPFGKSWDVSDLDEKVRTGAVEKCVKFFDLRELYGAKYFILHPSYEPIKDADRPARIDKCLESLKVLAPIAKSKGIQISLENLPRTCLGNTSTEMIRLVDTVGMPEALQICFDSNHPLKEKPEEFVAAVGKRIVTTHMSDYDGLDEKHWLPYEGVIDWRAVMRELVKAGYPGPFVFETGRFKDRPAGVDEIYKTWVRVREDYEKNG